ncbi:MAG: class I SAM-dependent methyltransferase [Pseudomonadota bacterium]
MAKDNNLKDLFSPDDYLYFYSDLLNEKRSEKEVGFLVDKLRLKAPMKLLDLPCGFGRHSNRLAKLGLDVTGVDVTEGFLKIAKTKAASLGVEVKYLKGDMRKVKFKREFDRAIMIFTAFGYFDDKDNFRVLKNIHRALKDDGIFCFDTVNKDVFSKQYLPFVVNDKDGDLMIDRNHYDEKKSRIYNERIIVRDGVRRDVDYFLRLYNPNEIRTLLKKAHFSNVAIYADWDGAPFTDEDMRMIIVAHKSSM